MSVKFKSMKELGKGNWKVAKTFGGKPSEATKRKGYKGNGRNPQAELFEIAKAIYPNAKENWVGAVVGRKYELDVAFIELKLGLECDGWSSHGRFKSGFLRDREKDRLLLINNWRILRFSAGEIMKKPNEVTEVIEKVVKMLSEN